MQKFAIFAFVAASLWACLAQGVQAGYETPGSVFNDRYAPWAANAFARGTG